MQRRCRIWRWVSPTPRSRNWWACISTLSQKSKNLECSSEQKRPHNRILFFAACMWTGSLLKELWIFNLNIELSYRVLHVQFRKHKRFLPCSTFCGKKPTISTIFQPFLHRLKNRGCTALFTSLTNQQFIDYIINDEKSLIASTEWLITKRYWGLASIITVWIERRL